MEGQAILLTGCRVGIVKPGPRRTRGCGVEIAAVFEVKTLRRGVLTAISSAPQFFSEQDLHFFEAIAHRADIAIHRAELLFLFDLLQGHAS